MSPVCWRSVLNDRIRRPHQTISAVPSSVFKWHVWSLGLNHRDVYTYIAEVYIYIYGLIDQARPCNETCWSFLTGTRHMFFSLSFLFFFPLCYFILFFLFPQDKAASRRKKDPNNKEWGRDKREGNLTDQANSMPIKSDGDVWHGYYLPEERNYLLLVWMIHVIL